MTTSISGVTRVTVLDNNQLEIENKDGDTTIHDGVLDEITVDGLGPFTVTFKTSKLVNFNTVGDLIDHLDSLGRERPLIVDDDGDTYNVDSSMINIWDENDLDGESPVAIFRTLI